LRFTSYSWKTSSPSCGRGVESCESDLSDPSGDAKFSDPSKCTFDLQRSKAEYLNVFCFQNIVFTFIL